MVFLCYSWDHTGPQAAASTTCADIRHWKVIGAGSKVNQRTWVYPTVLQSYPSPFLSFLTWQTSSSSSTSLPYLVPFFVLNYVLLGYNLCICISCKTHPLKIWLKKYFWICFSVFLILYVWRRGSFNLSSPPPLDARLIAVGNKTQMCWKNFIIRENTLKR